MTTRAIPPTHVERTVQAIAELHVAHYGQATRVERVVDGLTRVVGRPASIGILALVLVAWIGGNVALEHLGRDAFDPPPFQWLQDIGTLLGLCITVLILNTQRREDELAVRRDQLTLELAILSDQKTAKIIELLEELRRDHPQIADRIDSQASEMAQPTNPHAVLHQIQDRQAEMLSSRDRSP
jgi:uncharacterized membrane protein